MATEKEELAEINRLVEEAKSLGGTGLMPQTAPSAMSLIGGNERAMLDALGALPPAPQDTNLGGLRGWDLPSGVTPLNASEYAGVVQGSPQNYSGLARGAADYLQAGHIKHPLLTALIGTRFPGYQASKYEDVERGFGQLAQDPAAPPE